MEVFYKLLETIEKGSINNQITITNVELFVQSWKKEAESLQLRKADVNRCFSIGETVIIERTIYGHEFEIGDEVLIIDSDNDSNYNTKWLCKGKKFNWWIQEDEARLK